MEDTPESGAKLARIERELFTPPEPTVLIPGDERNPADADKKAMESLFAAAEERGVSHPKRLTEFELYARMEEWGKRAKPER